LVEALLSHGANLMMVGIFFYTYAKFGWGAQRNLELSCAQGVVYVLGALSAHPVSRLTGRRTLLLALNLALVVICALPVFLPGPMAVTAALLAYTFISAAQWPALESLVSSGASARQLSHRISVYNLVWSASGALTLAITGIAIFYCGEKIFLLPLVAHAIGAIVLLSPGLETASHGGGHEKPDPQLLPLRTLAMRLSRVALPATYAVTYALGAIMPTLPIIMSVSPQYRTPLASVWMVTRCLSFALLGLSVWWHARPRALLAAAVVLLVSFLGVTLVPSAAAMILSQIVLGLCVGLIYAGSLYFGMVLSDGSTAHGGYHEALIGLGSVLGPGAGVLAQRIGNGTQASAVWAVAVVLCISVVASAAVSLQARSRNRS
jgi:MFS family permease